MKYEVVLEDEAEWMLDALPVWLQGQVDARLLELENSPLEVSRHSVTPPHPPNFMVSEFEIGPIDGVSHYFTVFWKFGADPSTIIVKFIGHLLV